jgi:hypothetical protein
MLGWKEASLLAAVEPEDRAEAFAEACRSRGVKARVRSSGMIELEGQTMHMLRALVEAAEETGVIVERISEREMSWEEAFAMLLNKEVSERGQCPCCAE